MFENNMGQTDRIIRAIIGVLAIIGFFMVAGGWGWLLLIVGVVLLATAVMGYCPPYQMLGINTCRARR